MNLGSVIDVATNMASNEIKYRARLTKNYGKIPTVLANEGRLSQVFLNLIINATHAIEEGNVDNHEIRVKTWGDDDSVFAEVRDTGCGIREENLGRLFEPFFTTKKVGEGSGLGLAISKNIIESYGGSITVESELGKGTAFTLQLPIRKQEVVAAEKSPVRDDEGGMSGRILVVDDEDAIRIAIARILNKHEVVQAASGSEAKEILQGDQAFDLILCDVMMPEISGMAFHKWLGETYPKLARQFIFMTGGAFTPKAADYLSRVDNIRLEKPFDVVNLRKIVDNMLLAAR
ncbi:MAG: response regulator [Deltaproteobacteria bacterium]|nr:response regulator [Deltaproteobacteria bacterium]